MHPGDEAETDPEATQKSLEEQTLRRSVRLRWPFVEADDDLHFSSIFETYA